MITPVLRVCVLAIALGTLAVFPAPASPSCKAPAKGLGMWVWSESSFSTAGARQALIRFSEAHGISHLDIAVKITESDGRPTIEHEDALRELLLLASRHHITVAALRGSPTMFFAENHEKALRELGAIATFARSLPASGPLMGVKYDVEPYRTREWKDRGESRERVIADYLSFLGKARSLLNDENSGLWLAVDMPFWWDKEELAVQFDGKTKRLSEHVQDLTDFVVIMSYRRSVGTVMGCVENERTYARRINKVIFPSLETIKLTRDREISFWDLPTSEFWNAVPEIMSEAQADPAMGGLMLHCYRSLKEKFDKTRSISQEESAP